MTSVLRDTHDSGSKSVPVILVYHQIQRDGVCVERTSLLRTTFEEQITRLLASGWRAVSLATVLPIICSAEPHLPEPTFAITFDDAYADILDVTPWLVERQLPFTVFVLTDYCGQNNFWNPRAHAIKRHLSADEMLGLASKGVDFQFHGCDHHRLTKFDADQVNRIMARGHEAFRVILGRTASTIAYPYGAFDDRVATVAAKYFRYGLSVSQGLWTGSAARYCMNRIEVTNNMTPDMLISVVSLRAVIHP